MTCTHCNKPADDCDCETMAGIYESAAALDEAYVLLKDGLYWKPGGYTGRLDDAGRFEKQHALDTARLTPAISAIPLSAAPRHAPKCDPHVIALDLQADAAKAFEAERAARLAAEAERDRLREEIKQSEEARNLLADTIGLLLPHLKGIKISADFGAKLKAIYDRAAALNQETKHD